MHQLGEFVKSQCLIFSGYGNREVITDFPHRILSLMALVIYTACYVIVRISWFLGSLVNVSSGSPQNDVPLSPNCS